MKFPGLAMPQRWGAAQNSVCDVWVCLKLRNCHQKQPFGNDSFKKTMHFTIKIFYIMM